MKPGQLGNKMKCQHFTIFFVFMIRELKLWNFQRQLIFFHALICILVITRNILHAICYTPIVIMLSSMINFPKKIEFELWLWDSVLTNKRSMRYKFHIIIIIVLPQVAFTKWDITRYLFPGPRGLIFSENILYKPWSYWRAAAAMWIFPSLN